MRADPNRFTSAVACAKTGVRALDALSIWIRDLTPKEREEVRRRLLAAFDWEAVALWEGAWLVADRE
jgi:hypothetical protein